MFRGRFSSCYGAVGIDLSSRAIKMLQLRERSGELAVVGAATEPIPFTEDGKVDGEKMTRQIRHAIATGGFSGRRCVISLPRKQVKIQSIRLPRMSDPELLEAARWEAAQRFEFDRQAMEVSILRTGASPQGGESREEVLLVAASHAVINEYVNPIVTAGLRPLAIDTDFGATARIFSRQYRREGDRDQVRVVIEIGESGATVEILRGDQVAFCKPIGGGGRDFTKAVAEHLQITPKAAEELRASRLIAARHGSEKSVKDEKTDRAVYEAVRPLLGDLVKEVTLCIRYYGVTFRGRPPFQIILAGGDGQEPNLDRMIQESCKLPVVYDDQIETLAGLQRQIRDSFNRDPGPPGCWAVAAGLSLRGLSEIRHSLTIQNDHGARRGAA